MGFAIKHQAWHWQANYLPLTINAFKIPPCLHNFHVKTQALASRFYSENQCSKVAARNTGTTPDHDEVVGVEIVHGTEECRRRSLELHEELGFPKEVLPLKDLEEC
ncbi:hypothetical protein Drorol1_Dr00021554, partial [Drosera rotundifolia]